MAGALDRWTGDRRRRHRELIERLSGDGALADAREGWLDHRRRHHGAAGDATARDRFAAALYYDFVVDRLTDAATDALGVRVSNRGHGGEFPAFRPLHRRVREADPGAFAVGDDDIPERPTAFLRRLHAAVLPRASRRARGEYYTPRGPAALAVERVAGDVDDLLLDPGCGAGVFLAAAVERKRGAGVDRILDAVVGVDVDPLAVSAAKLTYLLALAPELRAGREELVLPVHLADAVGLVDGADPPPRLEAGVDALVGNPPWVPWERLDATVKRRWRTGPVDRLGLFDRDGATARLGHANDDVSLPFVWTCLDRYLRPGGRAAFVLKRDLLVGPAGELLRRGRVGDRPVSMTGVDDFGDLRPFDREADAGAAVFRFRLDDAADPPIPATVWGRRDGTTPAFDSPSAMRSTLDRRETAVTPVDPDDPSGAWVRTDVERRALGDCDYRIRHGLKDDAKAVFSLDDSTVESIEPDHVFPYLRSKHVVKYGLFGHDRFLVPTRRLGGGDETELARETPRTHAYLDAHRDRLESRGSSWFDEGPFYSLFGLGPYTWAEYKVVWCRLGFKPHFAVASTRDDPLVGEKPVVPGDHCMFVATDDRREAHYLCALLNAAPYQRCLRTLASGGKASLTKATVSQLRLPAWNGAPRQRRLAERSLAAHDLVADAVAASDDKRAYNRRETPELDAVRADVDRLADDLLAGRRADDENS